MYKKIASASIIAILIMSLLAVVGVSIPVAAEVPRIELSASNLSKGFLEIKVYTDPGLTADNITLLVYNEDTSANADLVDGAAHSIDNVNYKFVATKYASGVYIAYLGASAVKSSEPEYPKVDLDDDATNGANIVWFNSGPDGETYVIKYAGTEAKATFKYYYVVLDVSVERSPAEYPPHGYVKFTITDLDYNVDPTKVDMEDLSSISVDVKVERPSTAETFGPYTGTLGNIFPGAGRGLTKANETGVNTSEFVFNGSLADLEAWLRTSGAGSGFSFEDGDIITITFKDEDYSGKSVDVEITIKSVSPTLKINTGDFSNEIEAEVDWFNYNLHSWDVDKIPTTANIALELVDSDLNVLDNVTLILEETDANTAVFKNTTELTWTTGTPNKHDGKIEVPLGSTGLKLRLKYGNIETYYDLTLHAPIVSLDKSEYYTTDTMTITLVDPDLNDDASSFEAYEATISSGTSIEDVKVKKGGVTYFNVSIYDLTAGAPVEATSGFTLKFVETGRSTGVFTAEIDISNLDVTEGHSYRLKISDKTSGEIGEVDFVIKAFVRSVSLDRSEYPVPQDAGASYAVKVHVTLTAPDENEHSEAIDSADVCYSIENYDGTLAKKGTKTLLETNVNTGVFEGTIEVYNSTKANLYKLIGGKIVVWYDIDGESDLDEDEPSAIAVFTLTSASIEIVPTSVAYGESLNITVIDPDSNVDSKSKDKIEVKLSFTDVNGNSQSPTITLEETGENTGVFRAELTVGKEIPGTGITLNPKPASEVDVKYTDKTLGISTPDTGFQEDTLVASFTIKTFTGVLTTDKDEYGPTAYMVVTIKDPDRNTNLLGKDSFEVTFSIEGIGTKTEPFEEVAANNGTFQKKIKIIDLAKSMKSDVKAKDLIGKRISIKYADPYDETGSELPIIDVVNIVSKDATITFDKDYYELGEVVTVTVEDLDANTDPDSKDSIQIRIYSDSDTVGITVNAYETDVNTGVFVAKVIVASEFGGGKVFAKYGDKLYAEYIDEYPADYAETGKAKTLTAQALVGVPIKKPFEIAAPTAVDPSTGAPVNETTVGKMLSISTTLENVDVVDRSFAYVVQVKDASGVVVYLSYIEGTVPAGYSFTPAISWTPTAPGVYTIEVFVWKSIAEPMAYSPVLTLTITVSE